jgi:hypothetical protein
MHTDTVEKLTIVQLKETLADWTGIDARVEMSHRSSLGSFGCVPQVILARVDPLPPELTMHEGDGLLLTFIGRSGDVNLTFVLYEKLFDHAVEFETELLIFLADVELIIDRAD